MGEDVCDISKKRGNDNFIAEKLKFTSKDREIQQEERKCWPRLREL